MEGSHATNKFLISHSPPHATNKFLTSHLLSQSWSTIQAKHDFPQILANPKYTPLWAQGSCLFFSFFIHMHMKCPNLTGVRAPKKASYLTREDALFYPVSCERDSHTHATRRRKVSLNHRHYALTVYWVKLLLYQRVSLVKQLFNHEVRWLARAAWVNMRVFRSCICVQALVVSRVPSVKSEST